MPGQQGRLGVHQPLSGGTGTGNGGQELVSWFLRAGLGEAGWQS